MTPQNTSTPFPANVRRLTLIAALLFTVALAAAAETPRERWLMDFGWRFHLGDAPDAGTKLNFPEPSDLAKTKAGELGLEAAEDAPDTGANLSFVQPAFNDQSWRALNLPHDWAVELPFDAEADFKHGFKPVGAHFPANSIGWYRREFTLPAADKGKTLWLEFDGVYRNALVWLNGRLLGRHLSGYGSFRYDVSAAANVGGKNVLVVRVDASRFEGWFYEGAGIYRHVWLVKALPLHLAPNGIFVTTTGILPAKTAGARNATVTVDLRVTNDSDQDADCVVISTIVGAGKKSFSGNESLSLTVKRGATATAACKISMRGAEAWSPESPKLYTLVTTVERGGKVVDRVETEFGVRTVAFDPEKGFLLNGEPYLIKGTCNHQDHAGVGSALPDRLQYFRVEKLKAMGANAYRTSHNPPTPELLAACDRLGMLVMDENRRMDTNAATLAELESFVLRDRNHPSVFIWSLGNEEPFLQGTNIGERVAATMQEFVHRLDPTRLCTVAMNGKWGEGFSKVIDVQGFNYHTKNIDAYRAKHPQQPEIGTETASTVGTRGIYDKDAPRGYVSAAGDERPGWGAKPWEWWPYFAAHPSASGGFLWTGFDYRGEPTPYKWPCIGSHFGVMDACGFPKDIYFYYQACWTDRPALHVLPHWNWPGKEGFEIPVRVFGNCQEVELFLNGKSLGKKTMPPLGELDWQVAYAPGVLSAKGFNHGKRAIETKIETTGAPAAIQLTPDRSTLGADGADVSVVSVAVLDAKGRVVPMADNPIQFELSGPGKIIGVGNGDPSSHEPDQANARRVFNGFAQVIVQSGREAGPLKLTATSAGLRAATAKLRTEAVSDRAALP